MPRPGPPIRPSKYQPIATFLAAQDTDTLTLSFAQIEAILGFALPTSAYSDAHWWGRPEFAWVRAWTAVDWRARLRIHAQAVVFTRVAAQEE